MPSQPFPFLMSLHLLPPPFQQVAVPSSSAMMGMVRPVTGADVGIRRAEIRPGLREIILCKDQDRKVGLRLRAIDNVSRDQLFSVTGRILQPITEKCEGLPMILGC